MKLDYPLRLGVHAVLGRCCLRCRRTLALLLKLCLTRLHSASSSSRCINAASRRTAALCCDSTSAIDA